MLYISNIFIVFITLVLTNTRLFVEADNYCSSFYENCCKVPGTGVCDEFDCKYFKESASDYDIAKVDELTGFVTYHFKYPPKYIPNNKLYDCMSYNHLMAKIEREAPKIIGKTNVLLVQELITDDTKYNYAKRKIAIKTNSPKFFRNFVNMAEFSERIIVLVSCWLGNILWDVFSSTIHLEVPKVLYVDLQGVNLSGHKMAKKGHGHCRFPPVKVVNLTDETNNSIIIEVEQKLYPNLIWLKEHNMESGLPPWVNKQNVNKSVWCRGSRFLMAFSNVTIDDDGVDIDFAENHLTYPYCNMYVVRDLKMLQIWMKKPDCSITGKRGYRDIYYDYTLEVYFELHGALWKPIQMYYTVSHLIHQHLYTKFREHCRRRRRQSHPELFYNKADGGFNFTSEPFIFKADRPHGKHDPFYTHEPITMRVNGAGGDNLSFKYSIMTIERMGIELNDEDGPYFFSKKNLKSEEQNKSKENQPPSIGADDAKNPSQPSSPSQDEVVSCDCKSMQGEEIEPSNSCDCNSFHDEEIRVESSNLCDCPPSGAPPQDKQNEPPASCECKSSNVKEESPKSCNCKSLRDGKGGESFKACKCKDSRPTSKHSEVPMSKSFNYLAPEGLIIISFIVILFF